MLALIRTFLFALPSDPNRLIIGIHITIIWDTDLQKSSDFLLNPICMYYLIVCIDLFVQLYVIQMK